MRMEQTAQEMEKPRELSSGWITWGPERVRPTNTDLIPTHGEPESVKEDPKRRRSLRRGKKASAGSRDLASGLSHRAIPAFWTRFIGHPSHTTS